MSAGEFREVDHDLLADYVGGALDDTGEAAVVARLIVADPAWAAAHMALTEATRAVGSDLADWGATPEPMPSEVADRLARALVDANLRDAPSAAATPPKVGLAVVPPAPGRDGDDNVVRPRRGWPRWAAPIAAAAGMAAFAGFGLTQLTGGDRPARDNSTAARDTVGPRDAQEDAPAVTSARSGSPQFARRPARVVSSGTDYGPGTLKGLPDDTGRPRYASPLTATDAAQGSFPAVPRALRPLADDAALAACLDAVTTAHGRGPIVVDVVDFASFQRAPAVVVAFTDGTAERWVWVAGPRCGHPGAGSDTRHHARVG
ncbi:hypothetical protein SAMN05444365_101996 [Micromonospora pattaloongensis]|uniref:Uncharacterized protein n=1 Tax=Micromonospora pattaloongensis TaxID=405436 RepID=A0A1H3HUJ9_9ACTN|nr:hypothetical protein [Micromonospora pattaloongensis]SDY19176.1 hypothetical protein SAMN05444365_101996 [Micromonospora pattaloongensis]